MSSIAPVRASLSHALVVVALASCTIEGPKANQTAYPISGLYTPGNRLGASDPTDMPVSNRCMSLPPVPPDAGLDTEGTLTVTYTTRSLDGRFAPRNCTVVWIETADEQYVATVELRAAIRRPGLVFWQDRACVDKLGPDVVATATLSDHEKEHMVVWSGLDFEEKPVPDAPYRVYIEVTESDKEPGEFAIYDFEKGPLPYDQETAGDPEGPLDTVRLTWEPGGGGG